MKRSDWGLVILFLSVSAYAINTQQVRDTGDVKQLGKDINIILQDTIPSNGGDTLFYRDVRNQRIGIGTKEPIATLDLFGPVKLSTYTTTEIDALSVGSRYQYIHNTTLDVPCFSTGTGAGAFVRATSTTTACR